MTPLESHEASEPHCGRAAPSGRCKLASMTTADQYRRFASHEAAGSSRSYERLAKFVADDAALVVFVDSLPRSKRQPNLLFAAVQFLSGPTEDPIQFGGGLHRRATRVEPRPVSCRADPQGDRTGSLESVADEDRFTGESVGSARRRRARGARPLAAVPVRIVRRRHGRECRRPAHVHRAGRHRGHLRHRGLRVRRARRGARRHGASPRPPALHWRPVVGRCRRRSPRRTGRRPASRAAPAGRQPNVGGRHRPDGAPPATRASARAAPHRVARSATPRRIDIV